MGQLRAFERNWAGCPSSVSPKQLSTHLYPQETYPHRLGPSAFVLCHPPGLAKAEYKQETREWGRKRSCDLSRLSSMAQVSLTLWRQGPLWSSWILRKLPALPHSRLGGKSEQQGLTWASHFLTVSLNPDSISPDNSFVKLSINYPIWDCHLFPAKTLTDT